ncbi:hypothetical protein [Kribbella sp. NPDC006257]
MARFPVAAILVLVISVVLRLIGGPPLDNTEKRQPLEMPSPPRTATCPT